MSQPDSAQNPESSSPTRLPLPDVVVMVLVVLAMLLVSGLLWLAVTRRGLDYDEVEHAHAAWLVSQGERPYHDFFECHPPYYWCLLAPVAKQTSHTARSVLLLRGVSVVLNLSFLAVLAVSASPSGHRGSGTALAGLLLLLVASHLFVVDYLLEFRPDGLSWLLVGVAFLILNLRGRTSKRLWLWFCLFALLCTLAVLNSPKVAVLVVFVSASDLCFRLGKRRRTLCAVLCGHVLGISVGLITGIIWLRVVDVNPLAAYHLTISYHLRFMESFHSSKNLFQAVLDTPILLTFLFVGACWWGYVSWKHRWLDAVTIGILAFLLFELFTVPLPYKQYYGPWLLLAAFPVAQVYSRTVIQPAKARAKILSAAALSIIVIAQVIYGTRVLIHQTGALGSLELMSLMRDLTNPESHVIVSPPFHPVCRKDVFYNWVRSLSDNGRDTEAIMSEWDYPPFSDRFSDDAYAKQLAENPPDLVFVFQGRLHLSARQEAAVKEFLVDHQTEYRRIRGPSWDLIVRKHLKEAGDKGLP